MLEVWTAYKLDQTDELRNKLMNAHSHLVRYNAERIHVKLPTEVELDDLISAGQFGLMDAIKAFDINRGIKFETYCSPRIRGAILDELRSMDWVPRLVRSRSSKIENTTKALLTELGRDPTGEEIAARLKVSMEEYHKVAKDANATTVTSLSRKWFETDNNKDVREIDVIEDKKVEKVSEKAEQWDLRQMLLKGFARAERLIVTLYYFEDMTMKEIGATLDLSESRVSQMHSNVISRMRAQFKDKGPLMAMLKAGNLAA